MSKVSKILALIRQFVPQILAHTKLAPIAQDVADAMAEVEAAGGAGGDKLAAVVKIAVKAAHATNEQAGHVVLDPEVVGATAGALISDAKAVVNIVNGAKPPHA